MISFSESLDSAEIPPRPIFSLPTSNDLAELMGKYLPTRPSFQTFELEDCSRQLSEHLGTHGFRLKIDSSLTSVGLHWAKKKLSAYLSNFLVTRKVLRYDPVTLLLRLLENWPSPPRWVSSHRCFSSCCLEAPGYLCEGETVV